MQKIEVQPYTWVYRTPGAHLAGTVVNMHRVQRRPGEERRWCIVVRSNGRLMQWIAGPRQAHDLVCSANLQQGDIIDVVYEGRGEPPMEGLEPPHQFSLSVDRARGRPATTRDETA